MQIVLAVGEANRLPSFNSPLMYSWHNSYYLGAAHGVSGIMTFLMMVMAMVLYVCIVTDINMLMLNC